VASRLRTALATLRLADGRVSRARIGIVVCGFALIYCVIAARLTMLGMMPETPDKRRTVAADSMTSSRPDIFDRKGRLLATDVESSMLYAEPNKKVGDVDEAVELITAVLPDLNATELRQKLSSRKGFVRIKREISLRQQGEIHRYGIPHIGFMRESKRVYPTGNEASHVLGHVNVDNQGIAGLERWIDTGGLADLHLAGLATGRALEPVNLALDLAVQHALRDELLAAKERYEANSTSGMVLNVRTGEIVAMASLPDYDPNVPANSVDPARLNRLTTGVYEMGSTFKALTVAMALDSGKATLASQFDARAPLQYGQFTISDFHAQHRVLSVPEVFTYSSNIGAAKMALAVGPEAHRAFLKKMGQLDRLKTELPESAQPLVPKTWAEINTATIAFGHGLSVAPLQAVMATAALVNGGLLIPPTFLKRSETEAAALAVRVIKPETSDKMRYLLRLNVEKGTAGRAEVDGYYVGGKTGTSEKVVRGHYSHDKVLSVFMGVFPCDAPEYLVLVMVDEPKNSGEEKGHATAGLNAAPTTGKIIARIAPMLGVKPRRDLPAADHLILASRRVAN
jgi:cell division protein FtsI (penicillin-binding protein 3)